MAALFLSGIFGGCGIRGSESSSGTGSGGGVSSSQGLLPSMEKLDRTQLERKAEEILLDRYGASCQADAANPIGSGPFDPVVMRITLTAPGGEEILVEMDERGENIRDNYPLVWMRPQAEEKADAVAKEVWPSASGTAELSASPFEGSWTKDSSLTDIFAGAGIIAEWQITIPEGKDGQEDAAADFSAKLYEEGLYGRMLFTFTDGEVFLHGTKDSPPTEAEIQQAFSK